MRIQRGGDADDKQQCGDDQEHKWVQEWCGTVSGQSASTSGRDGGNESNGGESEYGRTPKECREGIGGNDEQGDGGRCVSHRGSSGKKWIEIYKTY